MVFIEAHACETPLVSTDCNIPYDLLTPSEKKAVVPIGDWQQLSESIRHFQPSETGDELLHTIEKFRPEKIFRAYEDLLSN